MTETVITKYLHLKTLDLLNQLANSIHDRESPNLNQFFFSIDDIKVCEQFLKSMLLEYEFELSMLED